MQNFPDVALCVPAQTALGKNVGLRAVPRLERPADDFFGMPQPVSRGRVDPVDAQLKRTLNGGDGVTVVLRAPPPLPATAADSPRSIPYRGDVQIGIAKPPGFHFKSPRSCFAGFQSLPHVVQPA